MTVGPILSDGASDIFCDNEKGPNFLFRNQGNGTFVDVASSTGEGWRWGPPGSLPCPPRCTVRGGGPVMAGV